jgi:hypothetical protein
MASEGVKAKLEAIKSMVEEAIAECGSEESYEDSESPAPEVSGPDKNKAISAIIKSKYNK